MARRNRSTIVRSELTGTRGHTGAHGCRATRRATAAATRVFA